MVKIEFEGTPPRRYPDGPDEPNFPSNISNKQADYVDKLDQCHNFQEIFSLVKRSVREALNVERTGLILYLRDLPIMMGAYHQIGTNGIIMNRTLLEQVVQTAASKREINSFIYNILLHEYLHTLGYINEREVRKLTYIVSEETFGPDHAVTKMATEGPWASIKINPFYAPPPYEREVQIVRDFENPSHKYIS